MLPYCDEDMLKYESIQPHLRRDVTKYKKYQAKWIKRLLVNSFRNTLDLTEKQENALLNILTPLIDDDIDCVRTAATQTMANVSETSKPFVTKCVERGILKKLLNGFLSGGDASRKAVLSIIGSFAKVCEPDDLDVFIELRIVEFLIACFTSTNNALIEGASYAIIDMVKHTRLVTELVTKGLLRLVALLMVDDLRVAYTRTRALLALVRRISERQENALTNTLRHSGCLAAAGRLMYHSDQDLQKLALGVIMNVAMVSADYIAPLFSPHFISDVISFLIVNDGELKYYAGNIVKKTAESSKSRLCVMLENGVLESLLLGVQAARYCADAALPALAVVLRRSPNATVQRFFDLKGHYILADLLYHDCCELVYATIFHIYLDIHKRGVPYSATVANTNIYPRLTEMYKKPSTSPLMRSVITNSMAFIRDSTDWKVVWQFFFESLHRHAKFATKIVSEVLAKSKHERKCFMAAGGLTKVQEIEMDFNDPIRKYVKIIKSLYPQDVINYYKPDFIYSALDRIDQHDTEAELKKFYRRQLTGQNQGNAET